MLIQQLHAYLIYGFSDHGALMYQESKKEINKNCKPNWAIIVAQHLLTELTLESECLIDRYHSTDLAITKNVCENHDFRGKFADTSFGMYLYI